MITYELPTSSEVRLTFVYDMLGREVTVLVEREKECGSITRSQFDGSTLSSGVYIYTV